MTGADVWVAYSSTLSAAERRGDADPGRAQVRALLAEEVPGGFVHAQEVINVFGLAIPQWPGGLRPQRHGVRLSDQRVRHRLHGVNGQGK